MYKFKLYDRVIVLSDEDGKNTVGLKGFVCETDGDFHTVDFDKNDRGYRSQLFYSHEIKLISDIDVKKYYKGLTK